jgi:hypothetical protein
MRFLVFICVVLVGAPQTFATAQSSDWMIYEGKFFRIADNPLETFPWPGDNRPWFQIAPGVMSTANYRGYLWSKERRSRRSSDRAA